MSFIVTSYSKHLGFVKLPSNRVNSILKCSKKEDILQTSLSKDCYIDLEIACTEANPQGNSLIYYTKKMQTTDSMSNGFTLAILHALQQPSTQTHVPSSPQKDFEPFQSV